MAFAPPFQRPFSATFDRRAAAAAAPWWLSGGVAAANAVAVYQPKGAASLAASCVNLANPGTYDAAPGVAPTWDAATGWTFNGSSQYLTTGVRLYQPYTVLIGVSAVLSPSPGGDYALGIVSVSPSVVLYNMQFGSATVTGYGNGSSTQSKTGSPPVGVLGIAGAAAYRNGTDLGLNLGGAWSYNPNPAGGCMIGARNFGGSANAFAEMIAYAFAIFNTTLSAAQVAAISAAMAAL